MKFTAAQTTESNSPPVPNQQEFWDQWNEKWRFGNLDGFMQRQREFLLDYVQSIGLHNARILDAGCGTGWLGNSIASFGRVTGIDLSQNAIEEGRRCHPALDLIHGDFLTAKLPGPFDFILCADALSNMYDQPACIRRLAELLRPGGRLVLMSPNRNVWRHRVQLKPLGPGQVQLWHSVSEHVAMLEPYFAIERVATIDPGGNKGPLWWVENRYVRGGMGRLIGRKRWRSLLEAARLGRQLVFVARRR
jgi:SAM-dependent methyltransferase